MYSRSTDTKILTQTISYLVPCFLLISGHSGSLSWFGLSLNYLVKWMKFEYNLPCWFWLLWRMKVWYCCWIIIFFFVKSSCCWIERCSRYLHIYLVPEALDSIRCWWWFRIGAFCWKISLQILVNHGILISRTNLSLWSVLLFGLDRQSVAPGQSRLEIYW